MHRHLLKSIKDQCPYSIIRLGAGRYFIAIVFSISYLVCTENKSWFDWCSSIKVIWISLLSLDRWWFSYQIWAKPIKLATLIYIEAALMEVRWNGVQEEGWRWILSSSVFGNNQQMYQIWPSNVDGYVPGQHSIIRWLSAEDCSASLSAGRR